MSRWLLSLDVLVVLAFVIVGRDTHNEANEIGSVLATAAPFLIALAWGWVAMRAWTAPGSLTVGSGVAAVTIVGGMLIRRLVFQEGIALSFIVVTAALLLAAMVGWRAIAIVTRRRARSAA